MSEQSNMFPKLGVKDEKKPNNIWINPCKSLSKSDYESRQISYILKSRKKKKTEGKRNNKDNVKIGLPEKWEIMCYCYQININGGLVCLFDAKVGGMTE